MGDAISIATTGLQTYGRWLRAAANNIANADDTAPSNGQVYRSESVQATSLGAGSGGVGQGVAATVLRGPNGVLEQVPGNPMADAKGYLRSADVDLSRQIGDMITGQRAIQANAATIKRALDAYKAVLDMGNS